MLANPEQAGLMMEASAKDVATHYDRYKKLAGLRLAMWPGRVGFPPALTFLQSGESRHKYSIYDWKEWTSVIGTYTKSQSFTGPDKNIGPL